MVDNETFLRDILHSQELDQRNISELRGFRKQIADQIKFNIGGDPYIYYGGSYRKGTLISDNYDLDIVPLWKSSFNHSLSQIYTMVGALLEQKWDHVMEKRVGWQINIHYNFHIDVVPGKFSSAFGPMAYLYNSHTQNRLQTSVKIHNNYVVESKRQDVIRLMKLWKFRKRVPISTFILEQMVIMACEGMDIDLLEAQLKISLDFIYKNIELITLQDPANSSNKITDNLTKEEKEKIRKITWHSLNENTLGGIFRTYYP